MAGAVSGKTSLSQFKWNGRTWLVGQWDRDAMDAVSAHAFRAAKMACDTPQEAAEISRLLGLGMFSFQSIVAAGGLETTDVLSEFLFHLLRKEPDQQNVTRELAREMVDDDLEGNIGVAVTHANPRYGRLVQILKDRQAKARRKESAAPSTTDTTDTIEDRRPGRNSKRNGK